MDRRNSTNYRSVNSVKVLGVSWNVKSDTLHQEHSDLVKYAETLPPTKRSVLKLSAKIFDPIGLITPLTIHMKVLFQVLCSTDYDWDDELTPDLLSWWNCLIADMNALKTIRVPRCYFSWRADDPVGHQLHGFSDASCKAYAAVVYLHTEHANGDIEVNLVASKARVAPIKRQSIPRLELLGATILSRLVNTIEKSLVSLKTPPEVYYWADSLTTLCWIRNNKVWKPYVQHRVEEIREHSDPTHGKFVQGELNPADLPSRGCSAEELSRNQTWWSGPEFLKHSEESWPEQPLSSGIDNEEVSLSEVRKTSPAVVRSLVNLSQRQEPLRRIDEIMDCKRYSTKLRLLRVTATVQRCAKIWRNYNRGSKDIELTAEDLKQAERMWIKSIQEKTFADELQYLQGSNKSPKPIVTQLSLYLDEHGIIRCEGKIQHSSHHESAKQPILLPSKHWYTDLLIHERHRRVHHDGIRETVNCIREDYWILRARESVKRALKKCVTCKRIEGKPFATPRIPQLPPERVSEEPPFTNTGLDFGGPLYVRIPSQSESKESQKVCVAHQREQFI